MRYVESALVEKLANLVGHNGMATVLYALCHHIDHELPNEPTRIQPNLTRCRDLIAEAASLVDSNYKKGE